MAKTYQIQRIRNIGIVGHGDVGKTSLVSAILFSTGMINRLGKVEEGNTITDYDEEEVARKISINSALCYCEWRNHKLNIIDTPGYGVFLFDTKASLRVVDSGVVMVCGVSGVEVQTEKVWQFCNEFNLPRLLVINKMDRDRASFSRTMESINRHFGRQAVPLQMPLGEEKDFQGVIDLIKLKAYIYQGDPKGKLVEEEIPAKYLKEAEKNREYLVEMVAEMDDELLEKFFEAGSLTNEECTQGLRAGVLAGKIFPVLCCCSTKNIGTIPLVEAVIDYLPSPADIGEVKGTDPNDKSEITRQPSAEEPCSAFIFKTIADPYTGKISLLRVYSGCLKSDSTAYNASKGANERIGSISLLQGRTPTPVTEVCAGELASVSKLKETTTNDTLSDRSAPITYPPLQFPAPSISFAVEPKSRADEDKMSSSLARLVEEDPTIKIERDPQTRELLVSGTGQLHVEVTMSNLKRKYGVEVTLKQPKVPYRETATTSAKAQGKYKKQTGGRGQYGDCWIEIQPLEREADFEFVNKIVGGAIPRNFIPAVEKGIREALQSGVVAGYPAVNFRVILYDGSYHSVDSSELAFKIAGSLAFKKAMEKAKPVLLEPIMNVEIIAPKDYMGDLMGDLNSRRGKVQGMNPLGDIQVIRAQVPMAEMLSYGSDLNSMTGGRGSYQMDFSEYDEVPPPLAEKVIAEAKKAQEEKK